MEDSPIVNEAAPAKINLFLHVGDRRADGFHPLQSLAVFPACGDLLQAAAAQTLSLCVDGPFAGGLSGEGDNLVLRAARALGVTGKLILTKNLPVASGIGGGSADAAAALRALNRLWKLGKSEKDLGVVAENLGSDVPVCLADQPRWMEGRGEILSDIASMPALAILLVNPGVAVSTRDVFAALEKRSGVDMPRPAGRFRDMADLLRFLESTRNDLEAPALSRQPVIGEVLAALRGQPGGLFARMSGSGATCFGLFPDPESCNRAAAALRQANPGWWVMPSIVPEQGLAHEAAGQDIGPTPDGL